MDNDPIILEETVSADPPKEKHRMNERKRKRITTMVLTLLSLTVLFTSITYSWFIVDHTVIAPNVNANVMLPPNLKIGTPRDDFIDWDDTLGMTAIFPISPVCGDGIHFYTKSLSVFDASAYTNEVKQAADYSLFSYVTPDTLIPLDTAGKEAQTGMMDFVVESIYPGDLYISTESTFSPSFFESPYSSEMSQVSTGYIAGALRLAIFQKDSSGTYQLKCIWIPNPTYEFDAATTTFTPNGDVEDAYYFYSPSGSSVTTTTISTVTNDGYAVVNNVLYVWDITKCNVPFGSYSGTQDGNMRIVFWLDGSDRECVNALAGGKVDLSLGIYISNGEETS